MAEVVLDASAILAFLRREPGHETVRKVLPRSLLLTVNLTEIIAKLIERGASGKAAIQIVSALPAAIVPFDEPLAIQAGLAWESTRKSGLSLGDRACLALAAREGLPTLTTDRAWLQAGAAAEVRLIR